MKIFKTLIVISLFILPYSAFGALTDDIVSYWKLDEVSGSRSDTHSSNDLTDNNSVGSDTGKINNGALFDSSSKYLSLTDITDFNFERTDSFSFQFWANLTSLANNGYYIAHVRSGSPYEGYYVQYNSSGRLIFVIANNGGGSNLAYVQSDEGSVSTGWQHIVVTYDGSSSVSGMKAYINGSSVGLSSVFNNLSSSILYSGPLYLGNRESSLVNFSGILDEFGVWSRVLTEEEVVELYNSGSGLTYPFTEDTPPVGGSSDYDGPNLQEWLFVAGIIIFFLSLLAWPRIFKPIKDLNGN